MENTNTDARKAAEQVLAKHISFEIYDETERLYFIDAMLEFAQSHPATLDKGEVRDQAIEICDALNHAITCYHSNTFPAVEYLQKVLEKTKVIFIV